MRNLIRFLIQNSYFLLFLLLEIISVILIFSYNNYQRVKFLNSSTYIAGSVYELNNSVVNYFQLKNINNELARENAYLRNQLQEQLLSQIGKRETKDTITGQKFVFTTAKVINNSVNKQYNYLTINKGSLHGIKPDMGIINARGIVGVISRVSPHYSVGLSVLNKRWSVSSMIKKNGYYGSLSWNGVDPNTGLLNGIPIHASVSIGDTIVSSGYSAIFPKGIMVGTIKDFSIESGANYYDIEVELSTNFKSINYIDIVENLMQEEIKKLETQNNND